MFKESVPRSINTKRQATQHQRKTKIIVEKSTYHIEVMAK